MVTHMSIFSSNTHAYTIACHIHITVLTMIIMLYLVRRGINEIFIKFVLSIILCLPSGKPLVSLYNYVNI